MPMTNEELKLFIDNAVETTNRVLYRMAFLEQGLMNNTIPMGIVYDLPEETHTLIPAMNTTLLAVIRECDDIETIRSLANGYEACVERAKSVNRLTTIRIELYHSGGSSDYFEDCLLRVLVNSAWFRYNTCVTESVPDMHLWYSFDDAHAVRQYHESLYICPMCEAKQ